MLVWGLRRGDLRRYRRGGVTRVSSDERGYMKGRARCRGEEWKNIWR